MNKQAAELLKTQRDIGLGDDSKLYRAQPRTKIVLDNGRREEKRWQYERIAVNSYLKALYRAYLDPQWYGQMRFCCMCLLRLTFIPRQER